LQLKKTVGHGLIEEVGASFNSQTTLARPFVSQIFAPTMTTEIRLYKALLSSRCLCGWTVQLMKVESRSTRSSVVRAFRKIKDRFRGSAIDRGEQ
jgi:hypothetical protein